MVLGLTLFVYSQNASYNSIDGDGCLGQPTGKLCYQELYLGWPVNFHLIQPKDSNTKEIMVNLLFWILAVFIILSLIRYFRNKSSVSSRP